MKLIQYFMKSLNFTKGLNNLVISTAYPKPRFLNNLFALVFINHFFL